MNIEDAVPENKNRIKDNADSMLDLCGDIGEKLLKSGAEIFRVEESLERLLDAYGYHKHEVFAISSCIIITVCDGGENRTKAVRIKSYAINMARLGGLNHLCRTLCEERPPVSDAFEMLRRVLSQKPYPGWAGYLAYGCAASFFTLFYGGRLFDFILSFFCGLLVRATVVYLKNLNANTFFVNLVAAFMMTLPPLVLLYLGMPVDLDKVIIGTIMLLVPGVAITNVMRDVLTADFLTAVARLAEVLLISVAIAMGVAVAIAGTRILLGSYSIDAVPAEATFLSCIYAVCACLGFCIIFEIRNIRYMIAAGMMGGCGWLVYLLLSGIGSEIGRYFLAAAAAAALSEICARLMKTPVTVFLIVAILPLVPGGALYYAMKYMLDGNGSLFASYTMAVTEYAAAIAIGGSFVSALARLMTEQTRKHAGKKKS